MSGLFCTIPLTRQSGSGMLIKKGGTRVEFTYQKIGEFFGFLQNKYGVQICVKDYCGFVPVNKNLDVALQPYLAHTNAYCMYLKQDKATYYKCLSMIRKTHEKCTKDCKSFYGMCHAGLGEYVTPIVCNGELIGTINMGFFSPGEERSLFRIHKLCESSPILEEQEALRLYYKNIKEPAVQLEMVLPIMELVAEYLSMTYGTIQTTHNQITGRKRYDSSEDTILSHAAQFVRQNFINHISINELADFCHCSESYLSHIFKRRFGININTYVNKVRMEAAKDFLVNCDASIEEIAINVGFGDPNYFSRVFTHLVAIPPTEYRRRFQCEKAKTGFSH